jgi:hypothetical protein
MKVAVSMLKALVLTALVVALVTAIAQKVNAADPLPSGEVVVGHSQLEPAYNDLTGGFMYLLTPLGTPRWSIRPTNMRWPRCTSSSIPRPFPA